MRLLLALSLLGLAGCAFDDAAPPCPRELPADGDPCTVPQRCEHYYACDSLGVVSASCDGVAWSLGTPAPCEPKPCGEAGTCPPEQVCFIHLGEALTAYCDTPLGPIDCSRCGEEGCSDSGYSLGPAPPNPPHTIVCE